MFRFSFGVVLASTSLAVAGCGGGGGNSTPVKSAPTIAWATPAAVTYGTALSSTQLDAKASVAGSYSYSPAAGQVLTAGTHTLSVTFTPTDTTDYDSASSSVTLTVNQATPVISWATPASIVAGTALGGTQLDATASVAGSFVYSPAAGTVEGTVGTTMLSTTFTPTDTTDYTTATDKVSLTVTSSSQAPGTAYVDFGSANQTIRGFGGSTAWMPTMTTTQADALFGTGSGEIGLSILRVRIDPSSTVGSAANWGTELANAQAAQTASGGTASVIASPWTPPAAWKSNSSTVMGSLNTANYADYANYLESYVTFMASGGVNLYGISMQNEPDANVSYESCVWTPGQMDTWIAENGSVLTTKLIMPESEGFNISYSDPALDDASAVGNIGIIAGHLYGASPAYYANAENKGKQVWMTEHYLTPAGTQPAIADAIAAAEEIHNSLTVGDYNAYVWWWAIDWNPGSGVTNTGLIDTNSSPNYYGYALAQFSRFVRPGYVRANATASPVAGVYVSAYYGSGHSVIVAINSNTTATPLPIVIENATVTSVTPYQTTATAGVAQLSAVSVAGDTFTATLPAESITTFVQ
jgi:glucuronoarabinoxylan endo-1,4-beta-xylanase